MKTSWLYTLNVKEWKIARNFEWLWFNSNRVWFRSLRVKICFHDSLLCQSEGRSQRSDTKTPLFHGVNYWPIRNGYLPAVAACISHACAIACIARLTYAALRALCMLHKFIFQHGRWTAAAANRWGVAGGATISCRNHQNIYRWGHSIWFVDFWGLNYA